MHKYCAICVCVYVDVRVCPQVFHWGSNSDVAHNSAAQHSSYGLKGVWITPTMIISFSYIVSSLQSSSACIVQHNWMDVYIRIL